MAGTLDYLFGGTPPPSINTNIASSNGLPDWYQEFLRGTAGRAVDLASQDQTTPLPARSTAGFNNDQMQAFSTARGNVGAWRPGIAGASNLVQGMTPTLAMGADQASNAVAGGAANFTDNYKQYMSPYTSAVTDNIARLGTRNFNENIMPGINSSMIGSGQFGSERNADVLARAGRDASADITGAQSQAMQTGYATAGSLFGADASRQQQQQQLQASTALAGSGALAQGMNTQANTMGGLAQSASALGLGDAQALGAAGQQQQNFQQNVYDTNYQNAMDGVNRPWQVLNNTNSVVRGMQLPSTVTQSTNAPQQGAGYTTGALGALGAAYGATANRPAAYPTR